MAHDDGTVYIPKLDNNYYRNCYNTFTAATGGGGANGLFECSLVAVLLLCVRLAARNLLEGSE